MVRKRWNLLGATITPPKPIFNHSGNLLWRAICSYACRVSKEVLPTAYALKSLTHFYIQLLCKYSWPENAERIKIIRAVNERNLRRQKNHQYSRKDWWLKLNIVFIELWPETTPILIYQKSPIKTRHKNPPFQEIIRQK